MECAFTVICHAFYSKGNSVLFSFLREPISDLRSVSCHDEIPQPEGKRPLKNCVYVFILLLCDVTRDVVLTTGFNLPTIRIHRWLVYESPLMTSQWRHAREDVSDCDNWTHERRLLGLNSVAVLCLVSTMSQSQAGSCRQGRERKSLDFRWHSVVYYERSRNARSAFILALTDRLTAVGESEWVWVSGGRVCEFAIRKCSKPRRLLGLYIETQPAGWQVRRSQQLYLPPSMPVHYTSPAAWISGRATGTWLRGEGKGEKGGLVRWPLSISSWHQTPRRLDEWTIFTSSDF